MCLGIACLRRSAADAFYITDTRTLLASSIQQLLVPSHPASWDSKRVRCADKHQQWSEQRSGRPSLAKDQYPPGHATQQSSFRISSPVKPPEYGGTGLVLFLGHGGEDSQRGGLPFPEYPRNVGDGSRRPCGAHYSHTSAASPYPYPPIRRR